MGGRLPVAQALGDRGLFANLRGGGDLPPTGWAAGPLPPTGWAAGPPSPYISPPPPFGGSFETSKIQKKRREVRRSEAAKPCWILDLRFAGNYLSLIIQYHLCFKILHSLLVFVTGNKIYTVGRRITSMMVAQDARTGRRV